jgi:hypothetical protein
MKKMTTEPVSVEANANAPPTLPEFGRWRDVQRHFGIRRGTLYNLISEGKVNSVLLRRKGNVHGCRLIELESVRAYIYSLMNEQARK